MCRQWYLSAQTGPRSFRFLPPYGLDPRYAELLLYAPTEITPDYPPVAGSALRCSGFEQLLRPLLTSVAHPVISRSIMLLWISGFLKGDVEDDSLKYDLIVQPEHELAVLGILGWKNLEESPNGEWLLTSEQAQAIAAAVNMQLPTELDLFIGVRA